MEKGGKREIKKRERRGVDERGRKGEGETPPIHTSG